MRDGEREGGSTLEQEITVCMLAVSDFSLSSYMEES